MPGPSAEEVARQREAEETATRNKAAEEARLAEEERARARGLRGRRALLSGGEQGFPTTLGGV